MEFLGYIGSWMGFAFFESTNARIFSSQGASGADVYAGLAIGRDAYGVTELGPDGLQTYYQPRGSSGAATDPLFQIASLGWKTTFTSCILKAEASLRPYEAIRGGKVREFGGPLVTDNTEASGWAISVSLN